MSWFAAVLPPRSGLPDTLEAVASFRVKAAALSRPAAPMKADPSVVLLTNADGDVVVYPPSEKLVILAERRVKRTTR